MIRWRLGQTNPRGVQPFKKGLDYQDRLPGFDKMQDEMRASVIGTTESGQYVDGEGFNKALGWGGVRSGQGENPSFVLHGDAAGDLTNAVHWRVAGKRDMLKSFKYSTGDAKESANHNWGTGAILQDQGTGVVAAFIVHHGYHADRGSTAVSAGDKIREKHTKVLISEGERLVAIEAKALGLKEIPIVFLGDFNQDKDDFYDGPGEAMAAAGYVDAETVALKKYGPDSTYPNIPPGKPSHRRFDRIFVKKGTPVGWMRTVVGPPYTDHNGVSANLTLTNERI